MAYHVTLYRETVMNDLHVPKSVHEYKKPIHYAIML